MTKYYKVVTTNYNNETLESASVSQTTYNIKYVVGKFVYGNNGTKLFVFDTIDSARSFIDRYGWKYKHKVYECVVKGKIIRIKKISWWLFEGSMNSFWYNKKIKKGHTTKLSDVPKGTLCVDAVKLIKEIS